MYDVVALGIAVVDIAVSPVDKHILERDNTPVEKILMAPGGDAVNQALALKKLGRNVALSCRIGQDQMGDLLAGQLRHYGVDTSHIAVSKDSVTSTAIVLVSGNGDRNIVCLKGNNYDFCIRDINVEEVTNTRVLSIGSIFGMPKLEDNGLIHVLQRAKAKGVITFADMCSDKKGYKLAGVTSFLPYVDYFMPSEAESEHLTDGLPVEQASKIFRNAGASNVIIKLGDKGVYAECKDFTGYVNPFDISPLDTTGSGDAFCAGFIHSILAGKMLKECITFASACGAYNSLYLGANMSPINIITIKDFIKSLPIKKIY